MKVRLYSLLDRKLREFGPVFSDRNDESVRRQLQNMRGSGTMIDKYPEDFDLYFVGEFNTETGVAHGTHAGTSVLVAGMEEILSGQVQENLFGEAQ